ncbi:hypothetical protein ACSDR0_50235, partial [Streptosporangium sp. G11]|uniref:hypothetical protein n=1 Tax=Streptosporangium sp. G11 TaxID=3436926 RepID=UPI003EBE4866
RKGRRVIPAPLPLTGWLHDHLSNTFLDGPRQAVEMPLEHLQQRLAAGLHKIDDTLGSGVATALTAEMA